MVQAKHAIAASTSRRNFLKSAKIVFAAMAIPAIATDAVAEVPSLEDRISKLVSRYEAYGYSITATVRQGKCVGIYTHFPRPAPKIDPDDLFAMHEEYRVLSRKHDDEFAAYLINTGRIS